MSGTDVKAKKREAAQALGDVDGVGGIGIGWDREGAQVLQIDVQPGTDKKLIEERLSRLDVPFIVRLTKGFVKAW